MSDPPELRSPLVSFLGEALRRRADVDGRFPNLAGKITETYLAHLVDPGKFRSEEDKDKMVISRQKLSRLAREDRTVTLSIQELEALHCYLSQYDMGLDRRPLFSQPTALQSLAASRSVTFLLGAHMTQEGASMPHFDWLALVEIQRAVHKLGSSPHFDMFDVHGTKRKEGERQRPWTGVFGPGGPSAVCVASPRANQASERVLREMLRIGRGPTPWDKMPFYFAWHRDRAINEEPSRLARPLDSLKTDHPDLADYVERGEGWGLVARDRVFSSEHATRRVGDSHRLKDSVRTHAVLVAQRRREGQVWVVAAGVNGPGTYLAATQLPRMKGNLPHLDEPNAEAIVWGVVEGTVHLEPMVRLGQLPEPRDVHFVVGPGLWDPNTGQWIE